MSRFARINDRLHARSRASELVEDIRAIEAISDALARPPVSARPGERTLIGRFTLSWEVDDGQPFALAVFCRSGKDALEHLTWYLNQDGRHVLRRSPNEILVAR